VLVAAAATLALVRGARLFGKPKVEAPVAIVPPPAAPAPVAIAAPAAAPPTTTQPSPAATTRPAAPPPSAHKPPRRHASSHAHDARNREIHDPFHER
jgi:hypothetical protein